MTAVCEVLQEFMEEYQGKRGLVKTHMLLCLDRSPGATLRNTFDYLLSEEEHGKFSGKATGKTVNLEITDISQGFAGRMRFKGRITRFAGEEVAQ